MGITTKSNFKITSWEETPYDEPEGGPKLVRTAIKRTFQGDVEGESTALLVMCQAAEGSAGYVATERITGSVGARSGTFVIQHGGAIESGQVVESFGYVVPGSGTDELQGLRGKCAWRHDDHEATFTLDYEIV